MKKNERIAALVESLGATASLAHDPRYAGFFRCFNAAQYYEAHDVLEDLWLQTEGRDALFFKGLIQVAGAFVHLQKQFLHPDHAKHRHRLRPASRLFLLARTNLEPYAPAHLDLDVAGVCQLCGALAAAVVASDYRVNPWRPDRAPELHLAAAS